MRKCLSLIVGLCLLAASGGFSFADAKSGGTSKSGTSGGSGSHKGGGRHKKTV